MLTTYTSALKHLNLNMNFHLHIPSLEQLLKKKSKDLTNIKVHLNDLWIVHVSH